MTMNAAIMGLFLSHLPAGAGVVPGQEGGSPGAGSAQCPWGEETDPPASPGQGFPLYEPVFSPGKQGQWQHLPQARKGHDAEMAQPVAAPACYSYHQIAIISHSGQGRMGALRQWG